MRFWESDFLLFELNKLFIYSNRMREKIAREKTLYKINSLWCVFFFVIIIIIIRRNFLQKTSISTFFYNITKQLNLILFLSSVFFSLVHKFISRMKTLNDEEELSSLENMNVKKNNFTMNNKLNFLPREYFMLLSCLLD